MQANTRQSIAQNALILAWIIALSGTLITLYLGQIVGLPVCSLCWYQRICFYPLALILAIAIFRDDLSIAIYAIPLAILGALLALYHYLEQMIPGFAPIGFCSPGVDCKTIHLKLLGFITYPFLSFSACIAIIVLLTMHYRLNKPS